MYLWHTQRNRITQKWIFMSICIQCLITQVNMNSECDCNECVLQMRMFTCHSLRTLYLKVISCAVNYSGTLAPHFTWRPTLNNIPPVVDTGSSVNSTVQVTVPSFPRSVPRYTCYVMFSGLFFPSSANQTSTPIKTSGEWSVWVNICNNIIILIILNWLAESRIALAPPTVHPTNILYS